MERWRSTNFFEKLEEERRAFGRKSRRELVYSIAVWSEGAPLEKRAP